MMNYDTFVDDEDLDGGSGNECSGAGVAGPAGPQGPPGPAGPAGIQVQQAAILYIEPL